MTNFTASTRTVIKGMLGTAQTTKAIPTILCNGKWYADVPAGADSDAIVKHLNQQAAEATAYRAQFATEEEWMQHLDENDAG